MSGPGMSSFICLASMAPSSWPSCETINDYLLLLAGFSSHLYSGDTLVPIPKIMVRIRWMAISNADWAEFLAVCVLEKVLTVPTKKPLQ